jgi:hypothetical protein
MCHGFTEHNEKFRHLVVGGGVGIAIVTCDAFHLHVYSCLALMNKMRYFGNLSSVAA